MAQTYRNSRPVLEETKVQCPFDPAHQIAPDVLHKHLVKCESAIRKQPNSPYYHKVLDMKTCKFSVLHRIPSKELEEHEHTCPDRTRQLKSTAFKPLKGQSWMNCVDNSAVAAVPEVSNFDNEENWDEEPAVGGYDPLQKVSSDANLLYVKHGMTKSERKQFALERRKQAEEQKNQPKPLQSSTSAMNSKPSYPKPVGRGSATRQDNSALNDLASVGNGLPNLPQLGRGRGRGKNAGKVAPPPGFPSK